MAHIATYTTPTRVNFLDSAVGLVLKTCDVPQSLGVADEKGNKTVAAGTIFPANDATAKGILFEDVDVTYGNHEGSLLVAGRVYADHLPVEPSSAAKTALEGIGITFVDPIYAERDADTAAASTSTSAKSDS